MKDKTTMTEKNTVVTLDDLLDSASASVSGVVMIAALSEAVDAAKAEKKKAQAGVLKNLVTTFSESVNGSVANLRAARAAEKAAAKTVETLDRAFRYFAATGNPFPMFKAKGHAGSREAVSFAMSMGISVPPADAPAWEVPSDWVAPKS